jgi:hypothetical protein
METATLSMQLINKIGNVLSQLPYGQVAQLMSELQIELDRQPKGAKPNA